MPIRSTAACTSARKSSIPASRVAAVAGFHSSANARSSPAARIVCIWLWRGEKSMIDEWWPACGGSTSVGTSRRLRPVGEVAQRRQRAVGDHGVRRVPARLAPVHGDLGPPQQVVGRLEVGERRAQQPLPPVAELLDRRVATRIASVAIRSGTAAPQPAATATGAPVVCELDMAGSVPAAAPAVRRAAPDRRGTRTRSGGRSALHGPGAPEVEPLPESIPSPRSTSAAAWLSTNSAIVVTPSARAESVTALHERAVALDAPRCRA